MTSVPHVVIVSHRSFPSGGGEEDLFDKAHWVLERGWSVTWVSFQYGQSSLFTKVEYGTLSDNIATIHMPPIIDKWEFHAFLGALRPSVVLVIGRCIELLLGFKYAPYVAMYHFWTHFVSLGGKVNAHILQNTTKQLCQEFRAILADAARVVFVSPFMQRVAMQLGACVPTILPSAPTPRVISTKPYNPQARKWVLFVNGHHLKSSRILPTLIRRYPHLPIRVIVTEGEQNSEYALELINAMAERNNGAPVEIRSRVGDMKAMYAKSRICVVASVVDETFGRVALESMASGVPVALSKHGNLPFIGGSDGWYVNPADVSAACQSIATMYDDVDELLRLSDYYKNYALLNSVEHIKPAFHALLDDVCGFDARPTVMFFAPWSEQGLGTQVRSYCKHLESVDVKTVVLSYLPYDNMLKYTNPLEWTHPRLYQSQSIREKVNDSEVLSCIYVFKPSVFVIPETCWARVFEIADLVRTQTRVVGIPNIELVRRDELHKFKTFHLLLANNRLCQQVLGELNPVYSGFSLCKVAEFGSGTMPLLPLRFVLIGGQNLDGRKQGPKVVEAYVKAFAGVPESDRPQLILTSQNLESSKKTHEAVQHAKMRSIIFNCSPLTSAEVYDLYRHSDVAILLSKHEGLGMGFFEALQCGCPILTVDTQPHNEIVRPGVNGWCLPGSRVSMAENKSSLISSFDFSLDSCVEWMTEAALNPHETRKMRRSLIQSYSPEEDYASSLKDILVQKEEVEETTTPNVFLMKSKPSQSKYTKWYRR